MLIESFCNIRVDFFIFGTMAWLFSTICIAYCIIFFFLQRLDWGWCYPVLKLLGGRGETRPPSRVSVPPLTFRVSPSRFSVPPSRFPYCIKDFFLVFTWFRGQKLFNFRKRPFFLVFTRFRGQKNIISTKVLSHSECVWSRLQKRPTVQNFTV